jgi:hypothetical protein
MGYRWDFEKNHIVATGGIYIRTFPAADQIIIDSSAPQKPGLFANYVFAQSLLPKEHTVLIKKDGYFDYYKTLNVAESEVTKLEKIDLFKNTTKYDLLSEKTESFTISPDKKNILAESTNTQSLDFYYFGISSPENKTKYSLPLKSTLVSDIIWSGDSKKVLIKTQNISAATAYYLLDFTVKTQQTKPLSSLAKASDILFNPQDSSQIFYLENNTLYSVKLTAKPVVVIKNTISYAFYNNKITWLSTAGQLYQSDISGQNLELLADWPVNKNYITPQGAKIEVISGKIFATKYGYTYEYTPGEKYLKEVTLRAEITNPKFLQSPNGENMVYYDAGKIYLYAFKKSAYNKSDENDVRIFEATNGETISDCYWLNNDYVIFKSGNRIIISEIDFRGNINQVELQKSWPPNADSKNPKIIFNQQDNKVYVLTGNSLYSSEKLVQ